MLVGCDDPTGGGKHTIEYHENGLKSKEGSYKDGKAKGVQTFWDHKDHVTKTETWKNGELVK